MEGTPFVSVACIASSIENGEITYAAGTGIVLGPRHILTCAHVVNEAAGQPEENRVPPEGVFSFTVPIREGGSDCLFNARIVPDLWRPTDLPRTFGKAEDVAVLKLVDGESFSSEIATPTVHRGRLTELLNRRVKLIGFGADGVSSTVDGWVRSWNSEGHLQIDPAGNQRIVPHGYSGGPVWDVLNNQIVGMLVLRRSHENKTAASAFAAPITTIFKDLGLGEAETVSPGVSAIGTKSSSGSAIDRRDTEDTGRFEQLDTSGRSAEFRAWPVSIGIAAGLDRGRQVTVLVSDNAEQIRRELQEVEELLAECGTGSRFGERTWKVCSVTEGCGVEPNAIFDLTPIANDTVRVGDLALVFFEQNSRTFGASTVFVLPLKFRDLAIDLGHALSELAKDQDNAFSVICLKKWSREKAIGQLSSNQSSFVSNLRDKRRTMRRGRRVSAGADAKSDAQIRVLEQTDGHFDFESCTLTDVWLALLADHFGKVGEASTSHTPLQQCLALLAAMERAEHLRPAVFSLPVCKPIVEALCNAPLCVRAVVGLTSEAESTAQPPSWSGMSLQARRGRRLVAHAAIADVQNGDLFQ